jgi:hypothetical protein
MLEQESREGGLHGFEGRAATQHAEAGAVGRL